MNEDASPAYEEVRRIFTTFMLSRAIYAAAELGIADELGEEPRGIEQLAAATSCDQSTLYRLLRALASEGLFAETEPQKFVLTPRGACLRRDTPDSIRAFVLLLGDRSIQGAWGELAKSVRSGRPVFADVWGEPPFRYYASHPELGRIFNQAMSDETRQVSPQVARAYDFSRARTVVDIGGGLGGQLLAILREYPALKGVLFELPAVSDSARAFLRDQGEPGSRCEVTAGDFMQAIPAGACVYLLKRVLHDWPDDAAIRILERVRAVALPTSKLLIVELVIGHGNQSFPYAERQDLNMQVLFGGRERTLDEYAELLARAHFRLNQSFEMAGPHSVLEATPVTE